MKARLRGLFAALVSTCALAGLAKTANADPVIDDLSARLFDVDGKRVEFRLDTGVGSPRWKWASAGAFNMRMVQAPTDAAYAALGETFPAFCIELTQTIKLNETNGFKITMLENAPLDGGGMGAVAANGIRELVSRFFNHNASDTQNAAMQLAIWELVYDAGEKDLRYGAFRARGDYNAVTLAQSYLDQLTGGNVPAGKQVIALTNDCVQDLITIVPTPGAFALLALGGVVMALRRR